MTASLERAAMSDAGFDDFLRRLDALCEQLSPPERLFLGQVLLRASVSSQRSPGRPSALRPALLGPALAHLLLRVPRGAWVHTVRVGEIAVELELGLAFGTGHHPTTRLMLDLLRRHIRPAMRMLDLGTGTGILAIAAAKLGAADVLALDIKGDAVWLAGRNIARNGVGAVVRVEFGSLVERWPLAESPARRFDLIAANLGAAMIEHLAAALLAALSPGGVLIAGGVGVVEESLAQEGLARAGGVVTGTAVDGDWCAFVVARGDP